MPPHRTPLALLLSGLRSLRYCCVVLEEANLDQVLKEFDRCLDAEFMNPPFPFRCLMSSMHWNDQEEGLHDLVELTGTLTVPRYLCDRSQYQKPMTSKAAAVFFTVKELETWCHCTPASFNFIHDAIKGHEVFRNRGRRRQVDVKFQLFCALARLCCMGSSINRFASTFKASHGSILTYTTRCCTALNAIEKHFVRWPNAARRQALGRYGAERFGFPGYIGQQDGTHMYFLHSPSYDMHPEAYYDKLHQGGYGYNVLLTSDHTGSIIHYALGWPGQIHDSTVQMSLDMYSNPWSWFTKGEYLFVDAGFSRQMWAVPPFKAAQALRPENKAFNVAMRKGRCRIEHVNAVLKGRFASLKKIPIKIACDADLERVNSWCRACITLHNIFIRLKDEWHFEDEDEVRRAKKKTKEAKDDEGDVTGQEMQHMVRDRWLEANGWTAN
jgi:hypothetical protein